MKVSASKSATSPSCKTLAVILWKIVEKRTSYEYRKYNFIEFAIKNLYESNLNKFRNTLLVESENKKKNKIVRAEKRKSKHNN